MAKEYKSKTNEVLLDYYAHNGVDRTVHTATLMLKSSNHKSEKQFSMEVHGEICETVLEVMTLDYIKRNKLNWIVSKGLILKDIYNPNSGYMTELDFTVFTPNIILSFECKCYRGDKVLDKECSMYRDGKFLFDIYGQHIKHIDTLYDIFSPFRTENLELSNVSAIQASCFMFSLGTLRDERDSEWKNKMFITNEKNLYKFYDLFRDGIQHYDMESIQKCIDILDSKKDKFTGKHLGYVKSLAKNRR